MTTVPAEARSRPVPVPVPRSGEQLTPEALVAYVRERLEDDVVGVELSYGEVTIDVTPAAWRTAARLCRADARLDFDFFEFLAGVDAREEGFHVVLHLYSVRHGHHVQFRTLVPGGREAPSLPSLHDVYRGANWSERETYDMFGIEFEGHPGVAPRILTVENFEGWPLRKEFLLTTREVKPWPGLKEPKDPAQDESASTADGAPTGPSAEEKAAAAKEKAERAKRKAAEMRKKKAAERAQAMQSGEAQPGGPPEGGPPDGVPPEDSDAREFAARSGADSVVDEAARESGGERPGGPAMPSGAPGVEREGRHTGAKEQSGDRPAAETPGMTSPTQDAESGPPLQVSPAPGPDSDEPPADRPADDTSQARGVAYRSDRADESDESDDAASGRPYPGGSHAIGDEAEETDETADDGGDHDDGDGTGRGARPLGPDAS